MKNEKRRGGVRDETEIYLNYTQDELLDLFVRLDQVLGVNFKHEFSYSFKKTYNLNSVWKKNIPSKLKGH